MIAMVPEKRTKIVNYTCCQMVSEQKTKTVAYQCCHMIDQLGERAPGSSITLRINPGFGHGHSQKTNTGGEQSKHGIWHEQVGDCVQRAKKHNIAIAGIHMSCLQGSHQVAQ